MKIRELIFLSAIMAQVVLIFGVGFVAGHRWGFDSGYQLAEQKYLATIDVQAETLADLDNRLSAALARLQRYIERDSWTALASWYGEESGTHTASGRVFDPNELIAANWHLPFGAVLAVENISDPESLSYGRRVFVWVDDRGPAHWTKRTLDLSRGAAEQLGMIDDGLAVVRVWRIL